MQFLHRNVRCSEYGYTNQLFYKVCLFHHIDDAGVIEGMTAKLGVKGENNIAVPRTARCRKSIGTYQQVHFQYKFSARKCHDYFSTISVLLTDALATLHFFLFLLLMEIWFILFFFRSAKGVCAQNRVKCSRFCSCSCCNCIPTIFY